MTVVKGLFLGAQKSNECGCNVLVVHGFQQQLKMATNMGK